MKPNLIELQRTHYGFLATIDYYDRIGTIKYMGTKLECVRFLRRIGISCSPKVYKGV